VAAREVFSGRADRLSIALLAALCILAVLVFRDYGISNDEEVQHRYGELIVDYYVSGFRDVSLFNYKNLYLYGGLFDIVAVLLARILPFDVYLIRHLLSALIGVGGIAAAFATARLIAGPRAGLIALVALAICGPYFGGMFNHTKDVPFAAAMMGAIYFLLRAARDLPTPRWPHLAGFGLLFGAATGLRAMGLLLIGYALLLIAFSAFAASVRSQGAGATIRFALTGVLRFVPAILLGYAIMLAAWPWAALAPLNPLRAIFSFAHFHYEIRTIVAGEIYKMADVPWWYVPFYLSIKTPTLVLAGAALSIGFLIRAMMRDRIAFISGRRAETAFVAFVAIFPVLCEAVTEGPAFTGMRHFLFVVPPLAVLAGLGFDEALSALSARRFVEMSAAGLLVAAFLYNASVLARLHPYEYMFYNPLVGGLEGAQRRYEMDYWVNIMPDAVQALQEYLGLPKDKSQRVYTVGVCGEKFSFDNYADKRLQASKGWLESDFFIAPTHMNCDRLVDGRVVKTIRRMGVPIGVVKDRRGITQKALGQAF
jgi:hypothetical protein